MSFQKKRDISNRIPLTTKNIARVQENYEKEMKLREKSKIVLNGRVKSEGVLENGSVSGTDLEYEFLYSVSDDENADSYSYEFDAYPVAHRPQSPVVSDDTVHHNDCEDSNELNDSVKKKETLKNAPDNDLKGHNQSIEMTKEVAFRDTDSVVSKASSKHNVDNKPANYQRRKSVSYDPDLEKASAFIHGGGKNFSRSNTSLTPVKYGMKHLQMNYTKTNLETNQTVIFLDLLNNSQQSSQIRSEQIRHIERRLEVKRKSPLYSTSFYEHKKIPDPFHRNREKTTRSVAQKKIEREEKIKQKTDEIHTGYVPTQLTVRIADREEVEDIGKRCRYLRCQASSD